MKDLSDKQKEVWIKVANDALARCLKAGGKTDVCEASAIKQANAVAGGLEESRETVSLREKIQAALEETTVSESATFKSMVQAFLRSADGIAKHKSVPAKVKASIQNLRTLLHQTWGDIEAAGAVGTVEADKGVSGGGGSIEETVFDEVGGALLANSAQLVENGRMVRQN
jgi:hypothetical protein